MVALAPPTDKPQATRAEQLERGALVAASLDRARMCAASENLGTTPPASQSNSRTSAQQPVSPERDLEVARRAQELPVFERSGPLSHVIGADPLEGAKSQVQFLAPFDNGLAEEAGVITAAATLVARCSVEAPPVSTTQFRFISENPSAWALEQANSAEHRVANMPPELHEARLGIPGRVRTSAELSDAQVAKVLKAQLNHVTEQEIGDLVASFGSERRGLAREVLGVLSRTGNLDALSDVAEELCDNKYAKRHLYYTGNGGLADSLIYLANRKTVLRVKVASITRILYSRGGLCCSTGRFCTV